MTEGELHKRMLQHKLVRDVIDVVPSAMLIVTYSSGVKVRLGNELTPTDVLEAPKLAWEAEKEAFYTICMTDPDAPSRQNPKFREWLHWLVGNIRANDVDHGEVLADYVGAVPPKETGLHRYVLLLFRQQWKLAFNEMRLPSTCGDKRVRFNMRKFAIKYKLGVPQAGNFFLAQWDPSVPAIEEQLRGTVPL